MHMHHNLCALQLKLLGELYNRNDGPTSAARIPIGIYSSESWAVGFQLNSNFDYPYSLLSYLYQLGCGVR